MEQVMTSVSTQKPSFQSQAAAATAADVMQPPLTTVNQHDHVAAPAYLMKLGVVDIIDVCRALINAA